MPRLVVFRGDAVESEIRLTGSPVRLGRHADNDVVLDDKSSGVSRFHAEIRPEGNSYVIVDLNSRNGVWIGGRRVKEKATLLLGVPVTLGAFELALEDDASGSFDGRLPESRTVASVVSAGDTGQAARLAAQGTSSRTVPAQLRVPLSPATRQILLWSAAGAVVVLICGITYAFVRHRNRPVETIAAVVEPAAPVPTPQVETPPPPAEDPNKALNDQDLSAAQELMAANNPAGALRDHLQPLLERDPQNVAALELKRQADAAIEAARLKKSPAAKPEATEVETPGIPRRAGEAPGDYAARVRQLQAALAEGRTAADKQEFAAALARFRAVDHDAPKFQGVDALIADTVARQQKAVDSAIESGEQNEQAGKIADARRWYELALQRDPASVSARDKRAAIIIRINTAAEQLYSQASFALKSQNTTQAVRLFQQVVDTTMPGDEYREKAAKQLELLKR